MGELLILTNDVRVNNTSTSHDTLQAGLLDFGMSLCTLQASLFFTHFCRQNILLCNKNVSPNIYGGTTPQKISLFQIFESLKILKIFWARFWALGALAPFSILSCSLGPNYIRVSTVFLPSFFTVMPKVLTTGPKSMSDYGWPITTHTNPHCSIGHIGKYLLGTSHTDLQQQEKPFGWFFHTLQNYS